MADPVQCRRIPQPIPDGFVAQEGDFCWAGEPYPDGTRYLYIRLPGSLSSCFDALCCWKGADRGIEREWGWDGNEDAPTLTPSIADPCGYHGHLVAGVLEPCPDSKT